jgi:subtilisin family serine protease
VHNDGRGAYDKSHGTHVASTAAGNQVAVSNNKTTLMLSGMAPRARIAVYKVGNNNYAIHA